MSDKIKFEDLASEEAFKKFIAYGNEMIQTFTKLEDTIKGAMSALRGGLNINPKNVSDVESINSSIKKTADYSRSLEGIAKLKAKVARETEQARLAEIKLAQDRERAMDRYAAKLEKERLARDNAAKKAIENAEKERLAEIKLAQDREKAMDKFEKSIAKQATYPAQLRAMQKELIQLAEKGIGPGTKAFDDMAKKAGALKDKISDAKQTIQAFAADSKSAVAKNLFGQIGSDIKNLDFEGAADKAKQFAVVMSSITFKETLSGIKALASSLVDVGKALLSNPLIMLATIIAGISYAAYNMAKAFQSVERQTLTLSEAIIEQRKILEDYANRVSSAYIKISEALGRITKEQADAMRNDIKNKKENLDLQGKYKDDLIKLATELNVDLTKLEKGRLSETYKGDYEDLQNRKRFNLEKAKLDALYKKTFINLTKSQTIEALSIEIQGNIDRANEAKKAHQKLIDDQNKLNAEAYKNEFDWAKKLRDLRTGNIENDYDRRKKAIYDAYDDEVKAAEGHAKIIKELQIKLKRDLDAVDAEYFGDKLKAEEKSGTDIIDVYKKVDSNIAKTKQDTADKAKAERDKEQKEEIDSALKTADQVLKIYDEYYQKIAELRTKEIDDEISKREANIEIQAGLAARGLQNTLNYEMQKKDEAEKARQEEMEREKKHAKAMEAAELGLAFIKAYESYIGNGSNSTQALGKAATDIFAAKIFSKAIAGAFATGVENFQGEGTGTSDSNLIAFSNGESVVTAKGTSETEGLVSAINKEGYQGAVDWAMKNIYQPQFNSVGVSDIGLKNNEGDAIVGVLVKKLDSLEQTIKNKPETSFRLDELGNLIRRRTENGKTLTTIKQRWIN